jgi:hypothetical protein
MKVTIDFNATDPDDVRAAEDVADALSNSATAIFRRSRNQLASRHDLVESHYKRQAESLLANKYETQADVSNLCGAAGSVVGEPAKSVYKAGDTVTVDKNSHSERAKRGWAKRRRKRKSR